MSPPVRILLLVLAGIAAAWALRPDAPAAAGPAELARYVAPTAASRARGFTFDGVAASDQQAVLAAVAGARPDARRLVEAVAGLVRIRVGPAGPGAAGRTTTTGTGYDVLLDLGGVSRSLGERGIDRLVLHELGHVVDFALVPDALATTLDAGIPPGTGCRSDEVGPGCAPRWERFAESFAKWAMDDIGVNLGLGYRVPPPALPLAAWAEPLMRLDR